MHFHKKTWLFQNHASFQQENLEKIKYFLKYITKSSPNIFIGRSKFRCNRGHKIPNILLNIKIIQKINVVESNCLESKKLSIFQIDTKKKLSI